MCLENYAGFTARWVGWILRPISCKGGKRCVLWWRGRVLGNAKPRRCRLWELRTCSARGELTGKGAKCPFPLLKVSLNTREIYLAKFVNRVL